MTDKYHVFLSYSRNDRGAAADLRGQLDKHGLYVFKDDDSIREGDLWLDRLQEAVDGCGAFVVLVGRDGVRRWIGAETQVALKRSFDHHDDAKRLPIFPILLRETKPETLPPLLQLFQTTQWNGADPLPQRLLDQIRERTIVANGGGTFEGCPFVGLAAYSIDQSNLFFGRQKETLDALACFDTRVRWLEINGNSGSGKSSLMNAGLLPVVDQGGLWPRTRYEHWRRIGPMMPGEHPVAMLAEHLARSFQVEMADVRRRLEGDDGALADWLRGRKEDETAFLLAIDQFEELFIFADADKRRRFDHLLAGALEDTDCPLFLISAVRTEFLDRFAEGLPRLAALRNRRGRPWTLTPIGDDGLREVIGSPAQLARIDVSEVKEAIVEQARDEPGALPLVENALHYLWEKRDGTRLSGRLFGDLGGLAGVLSRNADGLLSDFAAGQRTRAMELLFQLVRVDREGYRHARRRLSFDEAVDVAGGGASGRALVSRLAGGRALDHGKAEGAVRLITITEEGRWVNLIHETLIRSKGLYAAGKPQPYWPTLWDYLEKHRERAAWFESIQVDTRTWLEKGKNASYQWPHERVREAVAALKRGPPLMLSGDQQEFLGPIDPDAMLAELNRQETTHKRRLLIGQRLDILDDPRPGVGVDADGTPGIDWRPVPGGKVTVSILSAPSDPNSKVKDRRPKKVEPFRIARYPITVRQYCAFIAVKDGWRDPAWWGDDLYRDPEGDTCEFGPFGNHPAVDVSWFDAMAFCRWLSQRLAMNVRLPDEWEWQQAATGGGDENGFPWGADWDVNRELYRANTRESGLRSPTAVGMYPAGASAGDILDMAGTVWVWCHNKFEARNFDSRVLRGGSWYRNRAHARSAFRLKSSRDFRSDDIGFRVACW